MNLYKFLIIDNEIIESYFDPIKNDEIYGNYMEYRNRVYRLRDTDTYLMSFVYPNVDDGYNSDVWAYTIIDGNMVNIILKRKGVDEVKKKRISRI